MKTLMVWGVLIAGVMVLAGMAWRIWREVKRRRSISHKNRVFAGFRKPCRLQAGYVLRQVFSYAVWEAAIPSLPFPTAPGTLHRALRGTGARQPCAAFRRCYDPAADRSQR